VRIIAFNVRTTGQTRSPPTDLTLAAECGERSFRSPAMLREALTIVDVPDVR
jgi:hypothetical protein